MKTYRNDSTGPMTFRYCTVIGHGTEGHVHEWKDVLIPPGTAFTFDEMEINGPGIVADCDTRDMTDMTEPSL